MYKIGLSNISPLNSFLLSFKLTIRDYSFYTVIISFHFNPGFTMTSSVINLSSLGTTFRFYLPGALVGFNFLCTLLLFVVGGEHCVQTHNSWYLTTFLDFPNYYTSDEESREYEMFSDDFDVSGKALQNNVSNLIIILFVMKVACSV